MFCKTKDLNGSVLNQEQNFNNKIKLFLYLDIKYPRISEKTILQKHQMKYIFNVSIYHIIK